MSPAETALAGLILNARRITVMTGAGMSTESGIPDFRSYNGLWTRDHSLADVVSIDYFEHDPVAFWAAFKDIFRVKLAGGYQPNSGHLFLAWLEAQGRDVTIVTQNIDGLHGRAGSSKVIEVHGTLHRHVCRSCGTTHDLDWVLLHELPECRHCGDILKPDVVLYGEPVHRYDEACRAALVTDLLLVMGSSLEVGPVNRLPLEAHRAGIPTAIVNLDPTHFDAVFDVLVRARIGDTVAVLRDWLAGNDAT